MFSPKCPSDALIHKIARANHIRVEYKLIDEEGPAHRRKFMVEISITTSNKEISERFIGIGASIKLAKQASERDLLCHSSIFRDIQEKKKRKITIIENNMKNVELGKLLGINEDSKENSIYVKLSPRAVLARVSEFFSINVKYFLISPYRHVLINGDCLSYLKFAENNSKIKDKGFSINPHIPLNANQTPPCRIAVTFAGCQFVGEDACRQTAEQIAASAAINALRKSIISLCESSGNWDFATHNNSSCVSYTDSHFSGRRICIRVDSNVWRLRVLLSLHNDRPKFELKLDKNTCDSVEASKRTFFSCRCFSTRFGVSSPVTKATKTKALEASAKCMLDQLSSVCFLPAHGQNFISSDGSSRTFTVPSFKSDALLADRESTGNPPTFQKTPKSPSTRLGRGKLLQTTFQRNKAESTYGVWLNPITRLAQICRAYHLSGLEVIPTSDDVQTSNVYSDGIPTSIIQPVCASRPEVTCNKAQTRPSSVTIYSSPVYKLVPCSDPSIASGTRPEFLYQVSLSHSVCVRGQPAPNKRLAKRSAAEAGLAALGFAATLNSPVKSAVRKQTTFALPNDDVAASTATNANSQSSNWAPSSPLREPFGVPQAECQSTDEQVSVHDRTTVDGTLVMDRNSTSGSKREAFHIIFSCTRDVLIVNPIEPNSRQKYLPFNSTQLRRRRRHRELRLKRRFHSADVIHRPRSPFHKRNKFTCPNAKGSSDSTRSQYISHSVDGRQSHPILPAIGNKEIKFAFPADSEGDNESAAPVDIGSERFASADTYTQPNSSILISRREIRLKPDRSGRARSASGWTRSNRDSNNHGPSRPSKPATPLSRSASFSDKSKSISDSDPCGTIGHWSDLKEAKEMMTRFRRPVKSRSISQLVFLTTEDADEGEGLEQMTKTCVRDINSTMFGFEFTQASGVSSLSFLHDSKQNREFRSSPDIKLASLGVSPLFGETNPPSNSQPSYITACNQSSQSNCSTSVSYSVPSGPSSTLSLTAPRVSGRDSLLRFALLTQFASVILTDSLPNASSTFFDAPGVSISRASNGLHSDDALSSIGKTDPSAAKRTSMLQKPPADRMLINLCRCLGIFCQFTDYPPESPAAQGFLKRHVSGYHREGSRYVINLQARPHLPFGTSFLTVLLIGTCQPQLSSQIRIDNAYRSRSVPNTSPLIQDQKQRQGNIRASGQTAFSPESAPSFLATLLAFQQTTPSSPSSIDQLASGLCEIYRLVVVVDAFQRHQAHRLAALLALQKLPRINSFT